MSRLLLLLSAAAALRLPPQRLPTPRAAAPCMQLQIPDPFGMFKPKKKESGGALSRGIDEVVRDAPLPVKMAASLLKPLAGALETAFQDQQADADELLYQAEAALRADSRVTTAFGAGVAPGAVFSSSSASSSMGGAARRTTTLQFQLGTGGVGLARGEGAEGERMQLVELRVRAGGSDFSVDISGSSMGGSGDVIDVDAM